MTIRGLEERDIPRVIELAKQLAAHVDDPEPGLTPETLEGLAFGEARWLDALVAENNGDVVGFAAYTHQFELHTNSRTLFISDLAVASGSRGMGVGSRLLDALRKIAKVEGCTALTLDVWTRNDAARAFYAQHGAKREDDVDRLRLPV